ncbi:hypothetical protein PLESTB_001015300 [Pleodorina starrii]|uniref:Uncharacterized protein n=1 Tax=Pleodorina starrii TaxID=330485 RepID=A0A9W6F431_9CHLO|nr:hypothetical protein PLESTB_001015300 [Pleodorina starrii]
MRLCPPRLGPKQQQQQHSAAANQPEPAAAAEAAEAHEMDWRSDGMLGGWGGEAWEIQEIGPKASADVEAWRY